MNTHKNFFRESRLICFADFEGPKAVPAAGELSAPKEIDANPKNLRKDVENVLGLNTPGIRSLASMDDDQYRTALSGGKIDALMPPESEAGKDFKRAMEGFMNDMDKMMNSMDTKNLENMNFEQMFSV